MPNFLKVKDKAENFVFRALLPCLIFLALLIIFRPILIDWLNTILVNPILSKIPSDGWTDIGVLGLIGVGAFYWFKYWRKISFNTFAIGLFASFSMLYLDKHDSTWVFTPTSIFPNITYLTFGSFSILALLSISFCKHVIHLIDLQKKPKLEPIATFDNSDKPIITIENSLFPERNNKAKELAKKIIGYDDKKTAYGISVTGEYGSGKTSFLKLVEEQIKDKNNIIWFDPWIGNDSDVMIKDLLKSFDKILAKNHLGSSSKLTEYANVILGEQKGILSSLASKYLSDRSKTLKELKEQIAEKFKKLDRPIIVFIDNLDRLHPDEILTMLKTTRIVVDFPMTVFIIAFDEKVIIEALENNNFSDPKLYLEKFFQQKTPLKNEDKELQNKLKKWLDKAFEKNINLKENYEIPYTEKDIENLDLDIIRKVFTNIRQIKQFCDNLAYKYEPLDSKTHFSCYQELVFTDVFMLDLLDEIESGSKQYIHDRKDVILTKSDIYHYLPGKENLIEFNENKKEIVLNILENLFESTATKTEFINSIPSTHYFDKYFKARFTKKEDFSFAMFNNFLADIESLNTFSKLDAPNCQTELSENSLSHALDILLKKISKYSKKNSDLFSNYLYAAILLLKLNNQTPYNSQTHKNHTKLHKYIFNLSNKYLNDSNKHSRLVVKILDLAFKSSLALGLLEYLTNENTTKNDSFYKFKKKRIIEYNLLDYAENNFREAYKKNNYFDMDTKRYLAAWLRLIQIDAKDYRCRDSKLVLPNYFKEAVDKMILDMSVDKFITSFTYGPKYIDNLGNNRYYLDPTFKEIYKGKLAHFLKNKYPHKKRDSVFNEFVTDLERSDTIFPLQQLHPHPNWLMIRKLIIQIITFDALLKAHLILFFTKKHNN